MSRDTLITIYGVGAMLRGSGSLTQEQGGVPWPACASQPGPCCGGAVR